MFKMVLTFSLSLGQSMVLPLEVGGDRRLLWQAGFRD